MFSSYFESFFVFIFIFAFLLSVDNKVHKKYTKFKISEIDDILRYNKIINKNNNNNKIININSDKTINNNINNKIIVNNNNNNSNWTYFIFSIVWPKTFCFYYNNINNTKNNNNNKKQNNNKNIFSNQIIKKKLKKSKRNLCKVPPIVKDWTIHGLWPSSTTSKIEFCGENRTFDINEIKNLTDKLDVYWPDLFVESYGSLWCHEWGKHGVCSQDVQNFDSQYKFFNNSIYLLNNNNISDFLSKKSIVPSNEKKYPYDLVYSSLSEFFKNKFFMGCIFDKRTPDIQYLMQIKYCLSPQLEIINCPNHRNNINNNNNNNNDKKKNKINFYFSIHNTKAKCILNYTRNLNDDDNNKNYNYNKNYYNDKSNFKLKNNNNDNLYSIIMTNNNYDKNNDDLSENNNNNFYFLNNYNNKFLKKSTIYMESCQNTKSIIIPLM